MQVPEKYRSLRIQKSQDLAPTELFAIGRYSCLNYTDELAG